MRYFYLEDRLDQAFGAGVPRFTNIVRPGGCKGCSFLPLGVPPPSPLIVRPEARRMRCMFTGTTWGFCVIHLDLLEALGDEVRSRLLLGMMQLESGRPVEGYRTVRALEHVVIRDGPRSVHRVCSVCGALRYTCWPGEPAYVMEHQVRSRSPVYEDEAVSLLLREDIRELIGDRWSDVISFQEVPIVSQPQDGLPAELDIKPTPEQLVNYKPNIPPDLLKYAPKQ